MFDQERRNHSNESRVGCWEKTFVNRSKWNNSRSTSDSQEQTKNCISRWQSKRCRNLDFDEKKVERKHSTEMESMTIREENTLKQTRNDLLLLQRVHLYLKKQLTPVLWLTSTALRKSSPTMKKALVKFGVKPVLIGVAVVVFVVESKRERMSELSHSTSSSPYHTNRWRRGTFEFDDCQNPSRRYFHPCQNSSFVEKIIDWILFHSFSNIRPNIENHSE